MAEYDNVHYTVSVVTPSFKAEKYLAHTIESVLAQTYPHWEMLIVDDCSPDNANQLIESYAAKDNRIKLIKLEKNSGAAAARNKAIELAQGRYIAFLDADDLWMPEKLARQLEFMNNMDAAFSYTAYEKIDEKGITFQQMGIPVRTSYTALLKTCFIGCLTVVYDTKKLGKVYMPMDTKREDFATWLNILKSIEYAYGLPEVLAQYRVYQSQNSSKKAKMAGENWKLYRKIEKLSLVRSVYYFSHYAVNGVLRTKFPAFAKRLGVLK